MRVRRGWRQSGETQSCLALGLKTGYKGQGEYQEAPFLVFCRSLAGVGPFSSLKGQCCWPLESSWSGDRSCGSLGTITYQEEAVFGHGRGRRETKMGAPGLGIQGHFQNCNSSSRGPDVLFCHPQVPGMHVAPEHKEIHLAVARVRQ